MKAEEFEREARRMIREIEDPVELRAKLTAMVEEKFPVKAFEDGEELPMHEFLSRFQKHYCKGVVPAFYGLPVVVYTGQVKEALHVVIPAVVSGRQPAVSDKQN